MLDVLPLTASETAFTWTTSNKKIAKVSKTGKVTIEKKTKKCTIHINATSKANKNRKAAAKTIKIQVK